MILSIRDCAIDKVELKEAPDASLTGPPRCDALNTLVSDIAEHLLTTFWKKKEKRKKKEWRLTEDSSARFQAHCKQW